MAGTTILDPKVHSVGLVELVGIGVVKQVEERLTAPYIGNGTLVSGGIKLVGGYLAHKAVDNKPWLRMVPNAILIDAGEDLALGAMGMFMGGNRKEEAF